MATLKERLKEMDEMQAKGQNIDQLPMIRKILTSGITSSNLFNGLVVCDWIDHKRVYRLTKDALVLLKSLNVELTSQD